MEQSIIPFVDLKRQYLQIKNEVDVSLKRVFKRQHFILGEELLTFEKEFGHFLKAKYVTGVGSGTDGLILALMALEIGDEDEVITPINSFISTTLAITHVGATPVFIDINPSTYQIATDKIEQKITKKTRAILPVHLYGAPCQIDAIKKIAKKHHLYLIEDAAQAHGTKLNDKPVGTFGDLGVFSFYPGKNLGAWGDGGAVVTNNKCLYKKLLKLRNVGMKKKYYHEIVGLNSRLDEIQAAVLSVKLKYLNIWNKKRQYIADIYKKNLNHIKTQTIIKNGLSNYHLFVIEVNRRNALMEYLSKRGIQTLIHYPIPIHLQKCYRNLGYKIGDFPKGEYAAGRILSLPMFAELTQQEVVYITNTINKYYESI